MAKKRRTELDIDADLAPPPVAEPEPKPAEEPPPQEEETPVEPKGKINYVKLAIIGGIGLLILIVMGSIGYGVYSKFSEEPKQEIKEETKASAPKKKLLPKTKIKVDIPELYQFNPFLVRIGKGDKESLIRIDFAVEMSGAEVRKEIERNLVLIRENIYFLLSSQSIQTYTDQKKRRKMAIDVAIILNRSIQSGAVTKTLITGLTVF